MEQDNEGRRRSVRRQ